MRMLVYGVTGSGKTTMARRIGEKTGLPWHSVDDLTWEPGWVVVPPEEQRRRIQAICEEPRWVLDTAYGIWRDIPLAKAEMIVALDYPRWVSLSRLLRRTLTRLVNGKTICNGNRETLKGLLSRESILLWHFKSFGNKRRRIAEWAKSSDGPILVRLKRPSEAEAWLRELRQV